MKEEKLLRKRIIIINSILVVLLIIICLNFGIHAVRTINFNKEIHTLYSNEESADVEVSGSMTGEWQKGDALVPGVTKGGTYELTITDISDYDIAYWELRLNIEQECYLNQAWNGEVEIHQDVLSGNEKVDTLDLHKFEIDYANLNIESRGEGKNDLMIHLNQGDYIIYKPLKNSVTNEYPLGKTNNAAIIGMIFYYDETFTAPSNEITYNLSKSITQGTEFVIFAVLSIVWLLLFIASFVWAIVRKKTDKELADREAVLEETMELITSFVDAKDSYTKGHSNRVAEYTVLLAKKLGMSNDDIRHAFYAATLHDIGKCYVPDEILKKNGKLTKEEFDIIKTHTTYGGEMLKSINTIKNIADGAKYHHERYDGKGYPEGLSGENIPYIGRIICVADAFDAMTSSRCYREALSREYVVSELKNNLGKQFDPTVGKAMLELLEEKQIVIPAWMSENGKNTNAE